MKLLTVWNFCCRIVKPKLRQERIKIRKTIIITCGDGAGKVVKYLEDKFGLSVQYALTTASASGTFSSVGRIDEEVQFYISKKKSAMYDLEKYIGDADEVLIILVDHSRCAAWPEFLSEKLEKREHIRSLRSAEKVIRSELKMKRINSSIKIRLFYTERGENGKIKSIEEIKLY